MQKSSKPLGHIWTNVCNGQTEAHSDDASAKTNLARYCIQISDRYRKMSKMKIETGKKVIPFVRV